jgi:hypothetical protein
MTNTNRKFGLTFGVVFIVLAIAPLIKNHPVRLWAIGVSLIFIFTGLFKPEALTSLNKTWLKLGVFLGKLTTPLILSILFFVIIVPISFLMKMFKSDLLNLKYSSARTYWNEPQKLPSSMNDQF